MRKGSHRPIAVGEVLHSLTSKCVTLVFHGKAYDTRTPLQVVVEIRSGCEVIVHAVSSVLEDESIASGNR